MVRHFRVRENLLSRVLAAVPGSKRIPFESATNGGCTDPECCYQHPGYVHDRNGNRHAVVSVEVPLSGTKFHRLVRRLLDETGQAGVE